MFDNLRKAVLYLAALGDTHQRRKLGRDAVALFAGLGRQAVRDPEEAARSIKGFADTVSFHVAETGSWIPAEAVAAGKSGPFDACDLRHWLALAEIAGVPSVPAREIVSVAEEDMGLLSGRMEMPGGRAAESAERDRAALTALVEATIGPLPADTSPPVDTDERLRELDDILHAAMDGVPEGWMVRSARCGSSELKSLAGCGAAGPEVPEVRFGPDLEVGPGWVRHGNRRRVRVEDMRTIQMAAEGPDGPTAFLARPWLEAARYIVGEDPHRHGSQFAGKGVWPAEWRAFVEAGKVVGVSFYYGWCGEATPENARIALEVRELAQRIADAATRQRVWPRFGQLEFYRSAEAARAEADPAHVPEPVLAAMLEHFGRENVACTLDFIETDDGLLLLEGGPANLPIGAGHPCAFAGCGGLPRRGNKTLTQGVAFRTMPHVLLGDPSTWTDGDRTDCILDWDQVEALAVPVPAGP